MPAGVVFSHAEDILGRQRRPGPSHSACLLADRKRHSLELLDDLHGLQGRVVDVAGIETHTS